MNGDLLQAVLSARQRGERALLISGPIGVGKTTTVLSLANALQGSGLRVGGVASPRVLAAGQTLGYRVRDLISGQEKLLCSLNPPGIPFRRFFFSPEALEFANSLLKEAAAGAQMIFADEVGPLEISGGGFAPGMHAALSSRAFLVLTLRPSLIDAARRWAGLKRAPLFTLSRSPAGPPSLDETRQSFG